MKFTNKSRYGLKALIDMAANFNKKPVSINQLAVRNEISPLYLEQIFASLRRGKIVRSIKGPQGGYLFLKPVPEIYVGEIINVIEGNYHIEGVEDEDKLDAMEQAIQDSVVCKVNDALDEVLMSITLADLVKQYGEELQDNVEMYYI